jgi:hypothetical protein
MEMRNTALMVVCVFCSLCLNGQKLEVSGGINTTCFYSDYWSTGETGGTYSKRLGLQIGISINDVSADRFRFGLKLANYRGVYDNSFSALGGGRTYHVDISKFVIALEAFPLNFTLFTNLKLNIGGECNCLLFDATTGASHSWQMGTAPSQPGTSSSKKFEVGTWGGNNWISAGILTRIAYEIPLSDEWFFTPQFLFYVGLTQEFKDLSKTMRPYLEIGLAKKLPQKTR